MSIAHTVMKYHKEEEVVPCCQCKMSSAIYTHPSVPELTDIHSSCGPMCSDEILKRRGSGNVLMTTITGVA